MELIKVFIYIFMKLKASVLNRFPIDTSFSILPTGLKIIIEVLIIK